MYRNCIGEEIRFVGDKYRVLQRIGSGGFATVYKVLDEHIGKEFAMKIVPVSEKNSACGEPELLRQLEHPGLPGLHDVFFWENQVCIVMELAKGITLKEYVERQGKLTVKEGLYLGRQLGKILQYLHTRPIPVIHGDLKPQNIIVGEQGIRLIDFGGAFLQYDVRDVFVGTPGYAAPELEKGELFTPSDVYAFGKVMIYMFTGREAYLFNEETLIQGLKKYGIPRKIRKILQKCVEREVHRRFQSGQELLEVLLKSKGRMRHLPGRIMHELSTLLRMGSVFGMLYVINAGWHARYDGLILLFMINIGVILLSSLLAKLAIKSYKTAILECECSLFVSQGI